MSDRVLRSTPSTLSFTFYGDGLPEDPDGDAVTVNVFKADGTQLIANGSTTRLSQGVYAYNLASQAELNLLSVEWHATVGGDPVIDYSEVEIVGGFYFTIASLREYDSALADIVKYPDDRIVETRTFVESEFEDTCNRAFVPRFAREILTGDGTAELWLAKPSPLEVTKLVVDGEDLTATAELAADRYSPRTLLRRDSAWSTAGFDNIEIEYVYGMASPPPRIVEVAKQRARGKLVKKNARIDERATVMQIPDFGTFNLATPGQRGSYTGIPDVDVVLEKYMLGVEGVL